MVRRRHVLFALRHVGFRRLFGSRLAAQFGDGVFQASLAGAVLFNPERSASAADVAAGFAVLLLPYSLIGPFAGVLIDRWWRRQILTWANVARAVLVLGFAAETAAGVSGVGFYASALVLISVSRFVLSSLSASLPHVVDRAELVTGNSVTTIGGTLATSIGGGVAIAIRALLGDTNGDYAVIAALAAVPFLLAALVARGFARRELGPSDQQREERESVGEVLRGLVAGAGHVRDRPAVAAGLAAITLQRLLYGITTVCVLLLYRNYFHGDGFFRAGLAGLSQVVVAIAVGGFLAALVTPTAFRTVGPFRWPAAMLVLAGVALPLLVLPYSVPPLLVAVLVLAFVAQSVKISVDTLIQQQVLDDYRGRVFALYDALFNVMLVIAAVLTATALPDDGHSPTSVVVIGAGYVAVAVAYAAAGRRRHRRAPVPAI